MTGAFSTNCAVHIEDCEGCGGCMVVVAQWLHKPGALGSIPSLFTSYFHLKSSKRSLYFQHQARI